MRPVRCDSFERVCHDVDVSQSCSTSSEQKLKRFIGVIYRPETELQSHYAGVALVQQFDAWVWFNETRAITLLDTDKAREGVPDTYPCVL